MTALVVRSPLGPRRLAPGERLIVGREGDLPIADSRVSRHHVEIYFTEGRWIIRDLESRNGTFVGYHQISTLDVTARYAVRLGNPENGPLLDLLPEAAHSPSHPPSDKGATHRGAAEREHMATQLGAAGSGGSQLRAPTGQRPPDRMLPFGEIFRIGRAPGNELALPDDLLASRHHAEIRRTPQGPRLRDLRSRNGTHVNGHRVADAFLRPGDLVSVGHHQLIFQGDRIAVFQDTGAISLQAQELTVWYGQELGLDRVSLRLDERSLMAVVGPSGAGKSTLLGALTGSRPADYGRMIYEGRDLYAHYDDLRHRIGLVPQDDILHKELTVERALGYAASLRFPQDVSKAERQRRIEEVMDQLDLTARRNLRISKLSGGQRKRTSVALELLTKPSLLFLDEPTSGLDPSLDKEVMNTLRGLADGGRTVVVVTHSVLHLDVCDRVLLLGRGGKVGYFGPPGEMLAFFGVTEYSDVFKMVSDQPDLWQDRFRRSRYFAEYCGSGQAGPGRGDAQVMAPPPVPPKQSRMRQFGILARRMTSVIAADKLAAVSVVGLPLALGVMTWVLEGDHGLGPPGGRLGRSEEAGTLLIVLIFGAALMGLIGAIREIVKEGAIYRRERSVGLSPMAYLLSKAAVLGVINVAQSILFVVLALLWKEPPDDPLIFGSGRIEIIVVVAMVAFTCSVMALLVSALVSSNEQAMMVMVVLIMAQFMFMGKLIEVVGRAGLEQLTWFIPTRWGYAAAASTVDLQKIDIAKPEDALWDHDAGTWMMSMSILVVMVLVLGLGSRLALRRYETGSR